MKYRGMRFYKRYRHEKAEDYDEDDRKQMLQYTEERGFQRPIDVWLDNIKGILELELDHKMQWKQRIEERIYPMDAKWFFINVKMFWMAFVTPSSESGLEFLLTQNAYSIYEGANSTSFDPITGNLKQGPYVKFHVFAPISPRLMIVLRSDILPIPEEDLDPNTRLKRELRYKFTVSKLLNPKAAGQFLRELPITKSRNSYSQLSDKGIVPINEGPQGANDKFCFTFFAIPDEYTHRINAIMLEESYQAELIVFNRRSAIHKTLLHYFASLDELQTQLLLTSDQVETFRKLKIAIELLAPEVAASTIPGAASVPQMNDLLSCLTAKKTDSIKDIMLEDRLQSIFLKEDELQKLYARISVYSFCVKYFADMLQVENFSIQRISIKPAFCSICVSQWRTP